MKTDTEKTFFTKEQREKIKKIFCDPLKIVEAEAERFLEVCERSRLDPFLRQIYIRAQSVNKAKYNDKPNWVNEAIILTSIEGLRAVADRTGDYMGQTHPLWCSKDGVWTDIWLNDQVIPYGAKIGIHRRGFAEPLMGVARYLSYVQLTKGQKADGNRPAKEAGPTAFWFKSPDVMLIKCAEANALRRAFPLQLSGIYLEEEIHDDAEGDAKEAEEYLKKLEESKKPTGTFVEEVPYKGPSKPQEKAPESTATPPAETPKTEKTAKKEPAKAPDKEPAPPVAETPATPETPVGDDDQSPFGDTEEGEGEPACLDYKIVAVKAQGYVGKTLRDIGLDGLKWLAENKFKPHLAVVQKKKDAALEWKNIQEAIRFFEP